MAVMTFTDNTSFSNEATGQSVADHIAQGLAESDDVVIIPRTEVEKYVSSQGIPVPLSQSTAVLIGKALGMLGVDPNGKTPFVLQVAAAILLLWGTLFVGGWDIQSWGGVTLTERVNRWLFRFMYCIGTAAVVVSLSFA